MPPQHSAQGRNFGSKCLFDTSLLGVNANVRSIQGIVQILPKPLPLAEFQLFWDKLNDVRQLHAWREAHSRARNDLAKAKENPNLV